MEQFLAGPGQTVTNRAPSPNRSLETNPAILISESFNRLSPRRSVSPLPSEVMDDKSTVNQKISVSSMLENRTCDEIFLKKQIRFLMSCYERVGTEERSYPKVNWILFIIQFIGRHFAKCYKGGRTFFQVKSIVYIYCFKTKKIFALPNIGNDDTP